VEKGFRRGIEGGRLRSRQKLIIENLGNLGEDRTPSKIFSGVRRHLWSGVVSGEELSGDFCGKDQSGGGCGGDGKIYPPWWVFNLTGEPIKKTRGKIEKLVVGSSLIKNSFDFPRRRLRLAP